MKPLFFLLTAIICIQCSGNNSISKNHNQDTLFLDRDKYPSVFFEPNPDSKHKLFNDLSEIEDCSKNDTSLNTKWIQIERFNDEYVFFLGSEFGGINKYLFCGEYFYDILNSGDNPDPVRIKSKKKISPKEYIYEIDSTRTIHLYIIDNKEGIAITHDTRDGYRFMISQKSSYDIPVLSRYNKHTRIIDDFPFDDIDFEKVLKLNGFNK